MGYRLLADLIVAIHSAYVAFVLVGQISDPGRPLAGLAVGAELVVPGRPSDGHLIVAGEAVFDVACPLTTWESGCGSRSRPGGRAARSSATCCTTRSSSTPRRGRLRWRTSRFALLVIATFVVGAAELEAQVVIRDRTLHRRRLPSPTRVAASRFS